MSAQARLRRRGSPGRAPKIRRASSLTGWRLAVAIAALLVVPATAPGAPMFGCHHHAAGTDARGGHEAHRGTAPAGRHAHSAHEARDHDPASPQADEGRRHAHASSQAPEGHHHADTSSRAREEHRRADTSSRVPDDGHRDDGDPSCACDGWCPTGGSPSSPALAEGKDRAWLWTRVTRAAAPSARPVPSRFLPYFLPFANAPPSS